MVISKLSIVIVETKDNTNVLEEAFTQYKNPSLVYNATDAFNLIKSSELSFNFLVKEGDDYFDLFTGDETRYKVQLKNISDALSPQILWEGYLLSDLYEEPYKAGDYFINFLATDALGVLKNKYLPDAFFTSAKSVSAVLASCLKLSELEYPIDAGCFKKLKPFGSLSYLLAGAYGLLFYKKSVFKVSF